MPGMPGLSEHCPNVCRVRRGFDGLWTAAPCIMLWAGRLVSVKAVNYQVCAAVQLLFYRCLCLTALSVSVSVSNFQIALKQSFS